MLKIRLMRIGTKKTPFYRVVVVDERAKRTGSYVELLGTYNPLTKPKEIKLKQDRVDHWLKQGAQPSDGFLRIIGKAPQRPPRKPKKESAKEPEEAKEPKVEGTKEETKQDEQTATETPAEEVKAEESATPTETLAEENSQPSEPEITETPAEESAPAEDSSEENK